jgi:hypothetical protein
MPDVSVNLSSKSLASNETASLVMIRPDIPFDPENAFFPLRRRPSDGKIMPSYQFNECRKRFILCVKWEKVTVFFEDLEWFHQLNYGLVKMPKLK